MTTPLTIDLPEEFVDMCRRDRTTPETVLRGFIADLCCLQSLRADGYNSNGSDERELAWRYYDRAGYNLAHIEAMRLRSQESITTLETAE